MEKKFKILHNSQLDRLERDLAQFTKENLIIEADMNANKYEYFIFVKYYIRKEYETHMARVKELNAFSQDGEAHVIDYNPHTLFDNL